MGMEHLTMTSWLNRNADTGRRFAVGQVRNLTRRRDGSVQVWLALGERPFAGADEATLRHVALDAAYVYSQLPGEYHLRASSHPFQRDQWARNLAARTPTPMPTTTGFTFPDWLEAQQRQLSSAGSSEPFPLYGVTLPSTVTRKEWAELAHNAAERPGLALPDTKTTREAARVTRLFAGDAFSARPATTAEMWWLHHRSDALGVPAPQLPYLGSDVWDPYDFDQFSDPVDVSWHPAERTLRVVTVRDGQRVESRVAILVAGWMKGRDLAPLDRSRSAWLAYARQIGMPAVEWSARFRVKPGETFERDFINRFSRIRYIRKNYIENDSEAPIDTDLAVARTRQALHEVTAGDADVAARVVDSRWYVAIPGPDEPTLLEMVDHFQKKYATGMGIQWHHNPGAQAALARSFLPGEKPVNHPGMRQQMPVRFLATALPNATTSLGDGVGPLCGTTAEDGHRPFMFDPHYIHEAPGEVGDRGAFYPVFGDQGQGKTHFSIGQLHNGVERGVRCGAVDPAGTIAAALESLPEVRPVLRHVDLSMEADVTPGMLAASTFLPDPPRRSDESEDKWRRRVRQAHDARWQQMYDQLFGFLPKQLAAAGDTFGVLGESITTAGKAYGTNPWTVVQNLRVMARAGDGHAQRIARALEQVAESAGGRRFFPENTTGPVESIEEFEAGQSRYCTVVSMRGVTPPNPKVDPELWNIGDRIVFPMLDAATFLIARDVYADFTSPKLVVFDEGKIISRNPSGRALVFDLAENASRKHKAAIFFTMLDATPLEEIGLSNNNIGFVFHMNDAEQADKALRYLRREPGSRFVERVTRLPRGHCYVLDVHGRFGQVRIDYSWNPTLMEAAQSKPLDRSRAGATTTRAAA